MSYYHDLFQKFDNCPVLVAFGADWQQCVMPRRFPSLFAAAEHILDQQGDLESAVITAQTPTGCVDFCQEEILTLVNLYKSMRYNQD